MTFVYIDEEEDPLGVQQQIDVDLFLNADDDWNNMPQHIEGSRNPF